MKVKVTYLSVVRDAVGTDEEMLDIKEGSTVGELLSSIMAKHGERMKQVLDPSSDMGQSIMVMLNGELLSPSDMGKTVSAGAELLVGIPPFGG
ncbi:MAG TPA: MoaD/ThiS family protein [Candidatus Methanomethylicus sp.]|nr:MoaD/ThiS family protein [Candidatus Methanomethylicus sp.]HRR54093.1 MoaD/ThiS family protein [Candidatus Methanomethylicus sp.]HRU81205.1 MoaD/ThiS family protein [Candidatus Methanomethylicus sp.]